jgi:MYXO-CTERM domain-containing protein
VKILLLVVALLGAAAPAWAVPDAQVFRNGAVAESSSDDIGTSAAGTPRTVIYMIVNGGNTTLNLPNGVAVESPVNGTCSVALQPNVIVTAGNSTTFTMQFIPDAAGAFSCGISIFSDDPDSPFTFTMAGTATGGGGGQTPAVEVVGPDGPVENGAALAIAAFTSSTAIRSFTITNIGGGELVVGSISIRDNLGCNVTSFPGGRLANGESTTMEIAIDGNAVSYTPACTFQFQTNDPDDADFVFTIAFPPLLEIEVNNTVVRDDDVISFGRVDDSLGRLIYLFNRGGSVLEGIEVRAEGNCELEATTQTTLEPGEHLTLRFSIDARAGQTFTCDFVVVTDNLLFADTPFTVIGNRAPRGCATGSAEGGWLVLVVLGYVVRRRTRAR